jgi:hypothetical protein
VTEYLSRAIPHRDIAEAMLLQALPASLKRFIDLGTGDGRLIGLIREQYPDARAPGGVFVNLDLVTAVSGEQHERFRLAIGRAQDDPADRLSGLCDQLGWLRQAGFEDADCQFKWLQLALLVGTRSQ